MNQPIYRIFSENIDRSQVDALANAMSVHPLVAILLLQRGIDSPEKGRQFLFPSIRDIHDPYLLPDMDKAVVRITKAIHENQKVCIYGDYDVDGVTSVSILFRYLYSRGVNVSYYVPSREGEGYGMNSDAVTKLKNDGVQLIVTVDTGTTAVEEVAFANRNGIDVVITDHHMCKAKLPDAVAVVNPTREDSTYPFSKLAGVGVAFKLICALEGERFPELSYQECFEKMMAEYGDLVTLGTIADVMPLVEENRYIVKLGLSYAARTRNPGLSALIDTALEGKDNRGAKRRNLTGQMIGFSIAPKINAAGRMETADLAVELFLTESQSHAIDISQKLCELNKQRQSLENAIVSLAVKQIVEADLGDDPVLVLGGDDWHPGVIGIAAARIAQRYGKPTFLISFDGDEGKGSVRATEGFDVMAALGYSEDLLTKYGGHTFAAGLTVPRENFYELRKRLCEYANTYASDSLSQGMVVSADAEIGMYDVNLPFAKILADLAPFGSGNEQPTFLLSDLKVAQMVPLSGGKHTKLVLEKDRLMASALMFGVGPQNCICHVGDSVDVFCQLEINEYAGNTSVQIMVKKLFLSASVSECYESEKCRYKEIMSRACEMDDFPMRSDFALVYRFLQSCATDGMSELGYRYTCHRLNDMSYPKLRVILDIFKDTKLLDYRAEKEDDRFHFQINSVAQKVDIESSQLYRAIKPEF